MVGDVRRMRNHLQAHLGVPAEDHVLALRRHPLAADLEVTCSAACAGGRRQGLGWKDSRHVRNAVFAGHHLDVGDVAAGNIARFHQRASRYEPGQGVGIEVAGRKARREDDLLDLQPAGRAGEGERDNESDSAHEGVVEV